MAVLELTLSNWNFPIIFGEVAILLLTALVILYKFEGRRFSSASRTTRPEIPELENNPSAVGSISAGFVYSKDVWEACGGSVHPYSLLASRAISFVYLLTVNIIDATSRGNLLSLYYFYTEWTLSLLVIYFGVATYVSLSYCLPQMRRGHLRTDSAEDAEYGYPVLRSVSSLKPDGESATSGSSSWVEKAKTRWSGDLIAEGNREAGGFGYALQAFFQITVPAVLLTDGIYWILLYPMFPENYPHNFMEWNLHAMNAIFILIEFFFNSMPFPWFRGGYFIIYSGMFTVFQWTIHGLGLVKWPYPYYFMEIDPPLAPLWYFLLVVVHVLCIILSLLMVAAKRQVYMIIFTNKGATHPSGVLRKFIALVPMREKNPGKDKQI